MNYLSVCSGIEAATVAWHDLGWKPLGFSEIEKFPSEVLAHHYPNTPNLGDMTKYKEWDFETNRLDLLVGGTPCQSFSVAGLRKGLDDPRGNLALTYVGILDKFRPKWCVWENVPGVLSSGGGRDFGAFLGALGELGYGWSYRVLDAQYFGVPQRRRRVFVVGCLGSWEFAAKVLFESESLRWDIKKGRTKGKEIASYPPDCVGTLLARDYKGLGSFDHDKMVVQKVYENHPSDSRVKEMGETCQTVTSTWGMGGGNIHFVQNVVGALCARDYKGVGNQYVAEGKCISENMAVRRLTEVECERLQGFPDNYTNIRENCPSGARYKALGNSMAVPVMKWIGERIANV